MAVRTEWADSILRATASQALAEALICGIDECLQEKMPLTQLQQIHLAKMAIMSYDKILEGCVNLQFDLRLKTDYSRYE